MALFRRPTAHTVETCRAALDQLTKDVAAAEAKLATAALDSVLNPDDRRSDRAAAKLATLAQRRTVLEHALGDALRRERIDDDERQRREASARHRAFAQHLARLRKHAGEVEQAVADYARAWRSINDAMSSLTAMAAGPGDAARLYPGLSVDGLREMVEAELARVGCVLEPWGYRDDLPGVTARAIRSGEAVDLAPPLTRVVEDSTKFWGQRFGETQGVHIAPEPAPVAQPDPEPSPTPRRRRRTRPAPVTQDAQNVEPTPDDSPKASPAPAPPLQPQTRFGLRIDELIKG